MCTTLGFKYSQGCVMGRTLELALSLDHQILFVPAGNLEINKALTPSLYATLGTGFMGHLAFGDGINEQGLMGSYNFFPMANEFAETGVADKLNMITDTAFNLILTTCCTVGEVKDVAQTIHLLAFDPETGQASSTNHFMFMDPNGDTVVLEPNGAQFKVFDNPYGVLTNTPEFDFHVKNLSNYVNLHPTNPKSTYKPYGMGAGMLGLPGDFTPASRFVRAQYFVEHTDKNLVRSEAIMQAFRILNQFDIPKGSVIDAKNQHNDQTLYTAVMDSGKKTYHLKCLENTNIQSYKLSDFGADVTWLAPEKHLSL